MQGLAVPEAAPGWGRAAASAVAAQAGGEAALESDSAPHSGVVLGPDGVWKNQGWGEWGSDVSCDVLSVLYYRGSG